MSVIETIRSRVGEIPTGRPFASMALSRYGSREAVDQALSRLARGGEISRVARGIYVKPRRNTVLGTVPPSALDVARAVAEAEEAKIAPHGAAWALKLGLTTQMITNPTFLTDGPTRHVRMGKALLTLRHATPRQMRLSETPGGQAILALEWLGEPESLEPALHAIRKALSASEFQGFLEEATTARGWIAKSIHAHLAGRQAADTP